MKPYLRAIAEQTPVKDPGTGGVPSTDVFWLPATKIQMNANEDPESRAEEMRGIENPPADEVSAYNPDWAVSELAYPNLFGFFLFLLCGDVTTTIGNGIITDPDTIAIPAGAFKHVFSFKSGDIPRTCALDAADDADSGPWWKQTGAAIETLKISGNKGFLGMEAKGKSLFHKRVTANPLLTPAEPSISIRPWASRQIQIASWLTGTATTEDFDLEFKQEIEVGSDFSGPAGSMFPNSVELKTAQPRTLTGNMTKRRLDPDDWDAVFGAGTFAAMAKYTSNQMITGTYPYKMFVDMPKCQYVGGKPDDIENKARRGMKIEFAAKHDDTTGKAFLITLINGTSGYKTGL